MKYMILPLLVVLWHSPGMIGSASAETLKSGLFEVKTTESAEKIARFGLDQLGVIKTKDGYTIASRQEGQKWLLLGNFKEAESALVKLSAKGNVKETAELKIVETKSAGFKGVLKMGNQSLPFTANIAAVGGFYRCGNHPKAHLAHGAEEVVKLTEANGCADWSSGGEGEAFQLDLSQFANLAKPE